MTFFFGKELLNRLLCVSLANVYEFVCVSFPFGFEGGVWDLIVLILEHSLSILSWVVGWCDGAG